MLKIKGLDTLTKAFKSINGDGLADNYLLKLGERLRKLSISKSAKVSGEMVKETTSFKSKKDIVTVAVNVPYGAYNHQGERADGSRVIKNRTPPGQKYFLKKSAMELDLNSDVNVILDDLSKKLL
jgi:hypothetical protein